MRHRRVALLLAAGILLTGCSSDESAGADESTEASEMSTREAEVQRMQDAAQGLCDTSRLANSGDFQGAIEAYFGATHGYVHELASKLRSVDQASAAELLEADQQFESAMAAPTPDPGSVEGQGNALVAAFAQAVAAAGLPEPRCGAASIG